ncbi:response regulator containing a CheY-like receiver domain and an HTH DNA-binding domain [Cylindrospermum stagnale PCC 7417]|uniref:Response regulator containing a CheY-like receiver domain and an HTH DNA-binding domain n=1 Tax=Cylindrospermum stagnale PCC 7417 TaxID=56107 RepID=K9WXP0_9NOST|nr:helix-turn-helix transcriptional regulator [Cylindrospermum stagnale]AFZ24556.1 response regulator containing a CheY-like receiver domain and an HTH DNA-binding domain [Cylindrospermum stagnale PCC 7417]
MNKQQFQEALEKIKKAPKRVEVLQLVLDGHTNAKIAELKTLDEGTVRKHISNLYKNFGIKNEFPGDKPLKDQLKALFLQHKPEWVRDYSSELTTEISNQSKNQIHDSISSLVPSNSEFFTEIEEDLMSLAVSILEQLGFDQKFKMNGGGNCVGYRLKNPGTADKRYQLFIQGLYRD